MIKNNHSDRHSDHDLLLILNQKVSDLKDSVEQLQNGTFEKIASLEKDKADRVQVERLQIKLNEDMELRMRSLEHKTSTYKITLTLYSIAVGSMITLMIYHILNG